MSRVTSRLHQFQDLARQGDLGDQIEANLLREADCVVCERPIVMGPDDHAIHPRCLGWSAHRAYLRSYAMRSQGVRNE